MYNIEKISTDDFGAVLNLILGRWPEKRESYLRFFMEENSVYCWKCLRKGVIVGVLLGKETKKRNVRWLTIEIIIVRGEWRRKGIGTMLLTEADKERRKAGLKALFLNSGEADFTDGAFDFYRHNGFIVVGFVRNPAETLVYFTKE